MPVEVIMPKVDMDMASGKILAWHVSAGDEVSKGDPLFDIETDKAAMEVESPGDGILRFPVDEGAVVQIGRPVGWIYADGEVASDPPGGIPSSKDEFRQSVPGEATADGSRNNISSGPDNISGKFRASPLARSLARADGFEIATIVGTGPRGRIEAKDVRNYQARRESEADTSDALAVSESASGTGTPIILLHGFASDAKSWTRLESNLGQRPLVRMELPGHGRSQILKAVGFPDLAATVRQTFDGLNLDKAHLIGHSLGGALLLDLANARPDLVASLTLIAPAGLGPEINGELLAGILRATRSESLGPWLKKLVADESLVTESYVQAAMRDRMEQSTRAAQEAMADALFPDGVQAFDLRAALARVEVPTRILWGKQDRMIQWNHALRAPGRVAIHLLDGIGHMPQIEAPEEVARIIEANL
ncbi:MAG: acetoin dehydrogenase dihydrolipoyllysine-residue acetyltransferase subunit [Albidovulum sp.]|nr:acetoin dehydrogenase dihydrolipoyllysine-residue acetyltransferase subunit [Albidovulum sp.]